MTAQRLDPLRRQHVEEAERVGPAGEHVQPGVRGHRHDPPRPGQAGEQRARRVGPDAGAAQRAQHLGVTGQQLHPRRVLPLGQSLRDRHPRAGNTAQPQEPAAVARSLGVLDADDAQRARGPQSPVAAGDGLVGHAEDLRDRAERGAPVHSQALRQLPVEIIDRDAFHQNNASRCREPAHLPESDSVANRMSPILCREGGAPRTLLTADRADGSRAVPPPDDRSSIRQRRHRRQRRKASTGRNI